MTARGTASALAPLAALALVSRRPLRRAVVRSAVDVVTWGLDDVADGAGPFVFAANHPSALDAPLLRSVLEPVVGPVTVVSAAGSGGATGVVSFAAARLALRAGRSVVVFAESERSDDGELRAFGDEAARLAVETGAELVPVALSGSFAALPPWRVLPKAGRPRVAVTFARPIPTAASAEPGELASRAEREVGAAIDGMRGPWFAAQRAHAESARPDEADSGKRPARWRRIWNSSGTDARAARRRTWS